MGIIDAMDEAPQGHGHEAGNEAGHENGSVRQRRLLLLDTCGATASLALAAERGGVWAVEGTAEMPGRSASERLIPELRVLLRQLQWEAGSLGAIAVVNGPGSFTGVRVGLSAAKGLCQGLEIPLVTISRLAVLTRRVPSGGLVHALLDAGRGEVYWGRSLDGRYQGEEMVAIETLPVLIGQGTVVVCEERVAEALAGLRLTAVATLAAADALGIAAERMASRDFDDGSTADGNYLRHTEAEIRRRMREQDLARAGRIDA